MAIAHTIAKIQIVMLFLLVTYCLGGCGCIFSGVVEVIYRVLYLFAPF